LAELQKPDQRRVLAAIEKLSTNPRPPGCTKLSGFREVWRIRTGNFRTVYRIEDQVLVVEIIRIAHRRDVYRDL
jgi:mRNA interferase RelE/StbE